MNILGFEMFKITRRQKKYDHIYILDYKILNIEICSAKTFRLDRLDLKLIKSDLTIIIKSEC